MTFIITSSSWWKISCLVSFRKKTNFLGFIVVNIWKNNFYALTKLIFNLTLPRSVCMLPANTTKIFVWLKIQIQNIYKFLPTPGQRPRKGSAKSFFKGTLKMLLYFYSKLWTDLLFLKFSATMLGSIWLTSRSDRFCSIRRSCAFVLMLLY